MRSNAYESEIMRQPEPFPIELNDVCLSYKTIGNQVANALRGINLKIGRGSCTAIVGASGSGKSSLLRLIAGLSKPDQGEVHIRTSPSTTTSAGSIAMLFQGESHFPWRTVENNLAYRLSLAGKPRSEQHARATELCIRVGLNPGEYLSRFPHELSGGQLRRIELAMTLSTCPDIYLLDEPTTGLDYLVKREVQQLIEMVLLRQQSTTVIVTHDVAEAVLLSDRVVILDAGQVRGEMVVDLPSPRIPNQLVAPEMLEIVEKVVAIMREPRQT